LLWLFALQRADRSSNVNPVRTLIDRWRPADEPEPRTLQRRVRQRDGTARRRTPAANDRSGALDQPSRRASDRARGTAYCLAILKRFAIVRSCTFRAGWFASVMDRLPGIESFVPCRRDATAEPFAMSDTSSPLILVPLLASAQIRQHVAVRVTGS
jgi:hypothetical protein